MAYKIYSWGRFLRWIAEEAYHPASLEELKKIVIDAKARRLKIRVGGSLHTLNELIVSHEIQVFLDKLDKILAIDKVNLRMRAEGGIKLSKLVDDLAKEGLALPNQSYVLKQSLAGALATATHGTGHTGTLCSFVEEIELLDCNGNLRTLSPKENLHLFNAALVNLGCCGIVYSVTLKVIPVRKLKLVKTEVNLDESLQDFLSLQHNQDHILYLANPYIQQAVINCFKQTDEEPQNLWLLKFKWICRKAIACASMNLGIYPPCFMIPPTAGLFLKLSTIESAVDYNYKILSPDDAGYWAEEEINVPFEKLESALADVRAIIQKYADKRASMISMIALRFVSPDTYGYLSPAAGRLSAYISMIANRKKGFSKIFKEVEEALYKYGGRPHWGKVHFLTRERVAELYGKNHARFIDAMHELDPEGMFINEYAAKLF